uniref:Uncharacterized protein n=1 Tax=Ascaris lumbricoides TaxID=6252 RepID=A0A0M3HYI9_ASCLU
MFLDYSNIGNVKIRLLQLVFIFWQELLVVCFQIHLRMMITSSFVAVLVLIIAVHVCAQEEDEDGVLPERFVRSFPNNYLASDLALRFGKRHLTTLATEQRGTTDKKTEYGKDLLIQFQLNALRSWEMNGSSKRRIGINEKRRIDINDLALRFGKRSSYSFDPSNLNLRFGKRSFGGMLEGFDEKRTFVIPTDLALRFGKK